MTKSIDEISTLIDLLPFYEDGEKGDAELFARLNRGKVAFDWQSTTWHLWEGAYWREDTKSEVYQYAFNVSAEYAKQGANKAFLERAKGLLSKRKADSILALGAGQREIALTGDEWDRDGMILPCANGVVDLRTGAFRMAEAGEYIKSHSPVDWTGINTPCPEWEKFINAVMDNDADMVAYLQKLLGYCVSGNTQERVLPVFHGDGANGKSTLFETIAAVLGRDFVMSANPDNLMDTGRNNGASPNPFLCALRGKRLIYCQESREGARLNTPLIKNLTGQDTITTRNVFQGRLMTFSPTHKIILSTNHLPHVSADDTAAWDRLRPVEFPLRFVDNPAAENERKIDRGLSSKLLKENSGILAWLVRGCLAWQSEGLEMPVKIITDAEEYRDNEDDLGMFFDEHCLIGDTYTAKLATIYSDYKAWCGGYTLSPMSIKAFSQRLARKFGKPVHTRGGNVFNGIGIRAKM